MYGRRHPGSKYRPATRRLLSFQGVGEFLASKHSVGQRSQQMLIRQGVPADVADIASLVEHYWQFEAIGGFERARIEMALSALIGHPELGACWVAQEENTLRAYLVVVFMLSLEHGGMMAEIDEIFVQPNFRSRGIGASLLASAERDLVARGMVRLQLQLGVDNHRGRSFYARRGFSRRSEYEMLDKPL